MGRSVIVVGGGPAGLAVAVAARRRGLHATVLDRGERIGDTWAQRYDRLHLHTPRIQSRLPGYRIPRRYGRFVARDDFVRYLEDYARAYGIQPVLGVEVERIDPGVDGDGWLVTTSDGVRHAGRVVIATGYNNVPFVPEWPGRAQFGGQLVHASQYREPSSFAGKRVLVVGSGNTGAEIAADLAEGGAAQVYLSVRTPPHVVPRSFLGIPVTLLSITNEYLPVALTSPLSRLIARLAIGDLTRYGLPAPSEALVHAHRRTDTIPIIDVGLVEQLKAGRVTPVAEVVGFDRDDVLVGDRQRLCVDAVIAATGYRTGLEPIVGHLGVLDGAGRPTVSGPQAHPAAPGLHFVGIRNPLSGLLLAIRFDAIRVARALAASGT